MIGLSLRQIKKQPQVARFLLQAIAKGRVAHAYCFYGPSGTGKRAMALQFAKALNCEQPDENDACGRCPSCLKVEHGNHPDIVTLKPEGSVIKIDQLRAIQRRFRYSAPPGTTRVVILEQADRMRQEAANSLLKFLEEPVSPMVAILVTENMQAILPTILSRCQHVRFAELPPKQKENELLSKGIAPDPARILSYLPEESVLLYQADPETFSSLCEKVIHWSKSILSGNSEAYLTLAQPWIITELTNNRLPLVLDLLLLWLRDLLNNQLGQTDPVFAPWKTEIQEQAYLKPASYLITAMDNVLIARRLLMKSSIQPQAALEQMVLSTQAEKVSTENGWQLIQL
ncbi:MAG: DNA polymerase III subunit delta' [Thermoactinomyces sp.]